MEKVVKNIKTKKKDQSRFNYEVVRGLIKIMIDDLIENTKKNLKRYKINSYFDVLDSKEKLVTFSDFIANQELLLKNFLKINMYEHGRVKRMTIKAKKIIADLFDLFIKEPSLLPINWRGDSESKQFVMVCDYISGMTVKYAITMHKKFFDLYNL